MLRFLMTIFLGASFACTGGPEFDARILAPETIGPCDDLVLDAVVPSTVGDQTFVWTMTPSSAALDEVLGRANKPRLLIPSNLLSAGATYQFRVVVTINGSVSGPGEATVQRSEIEALLVSLDGPSQYVIDGTQGLTVTGRAQLPRCEMLPVAYRWVQTAGPPVTIPSAYERRNIISFEPGDLTPGQDYVFELQASVASNPPLTGSVSFAVEITRLSPIALIAGGSRNAGVCQTIAIDGRLSSSPDRLPLSYSWDCVTVGPTPVSCGVTLPQEPVIAIGSGTLPAGKHELTLNVSDGERQTQTSIEITVGCDATTPPTNTLSLTDGARVDPSQALVIHADVDDASACSSTITWSVANNLLDVNDPTEVLSSGSIFMVPAGVLVAGTTYSLKARAANCAGFDEKTVSFTANTPPSGGTCTVTPASGAAFDTMFHLSCSGWTDSDGPLKYQFSYIDGAGQRVPLAATGTAAALDTVLPEGFGTGTNRILGLRARVIDALSVQTAEQSLPDAAVVSPDRAVYADLSARFRAMLAAHQANIIATDVILRRAFNGVTAEQPLVFNGKGHALLAAVFVHVDHPAALTITSGTGCGAGVPLPANVKNVDFYGVFELDAAETLSLKAASADLLTGTAEVVLIDATTFDLPVSTTGVPFFENTRGALYQPHFDLTLQDPGGIDGLLWRACTPDPRAWTSVMAGPPQCTSGASLVSQVTRGDQPGSSAAIGEVLFVNVNAGARKVRFENLAECSEYLFAPLL
ncbi:MAG: hypothetical protein IT381_08210 [Deltaproteobacteria bacterium]|nr:hypothetical protein [Deltaproteobacteria bacterium]